MAEEIEPSDSPIMETVSVTHLDGKKNTGAVVGDARKPIPWVTYVLVVVVVAIIIYLFYYSYTCFCVNQNNNEPFIEKTIRTGIDDDRSFDIDKEVKRLSDLQEQYLRKLNSRRNF